MGIRIVNGGFMTTIQDLGRYGYQETGMSVSCVMDTRSACLANLLAGNDVDEAVIEVTMMGPTIRFLTDNIIAVTGGDLGAKLDGLAMPSYRAVHVNAGQTLSFAGMVSGSRAYIAFAGGLDIPVVMGSRSTNLKSRIGGFQGRKLGAGDEIGFRAPAEWLPNMAERRLAPDDFSARECTLRVVMGPQDDCFTEKGIDTFLNSTYKISNEYDRMGCRMEGEIIEHKAGGDIITDGISFGAVQVPSHGNPIVMMADHQTTGGYTKIANVISVDLPKLAQCMPGARIHFEKVSIEEAQRLYCEWNTEMKELAKKLTREAEPASDVQAVALAAAACADSLYWGKCAKYRVIVDGQEFFIEL